MKIMLMLKNNINNLLIRINFKISSCNVDICIYLHVYYIVDIIALPWTYVSGWLGLGFGVVICTISKNAFDTSYV